jgi:hypothetical protein
VDAQALTCPCERVGLIIQHATHRHIVICDLSFYPSSTLFHKWHDLQEKITEHKMCVLIFSTAFI